MRIRTTLAAAVLLLLPALLGAAPRTETAPNPEVRHEAVRARIRDHLEQKLWPWWLEHSVDERHGGFVLELARDGSVRDGRKMLVSQARQIWTFSRIWNEGYRDPRAARAARAGMAFLLQHFWDPQHGGWFLRTTREGQPRDTTKSTYAHAFVIYAAVEYARAFDEATGVRVAEATFDALERNAKDPDHAGYFERMGRDWRPSRWRGRDKSMNTALHLLEAFTELYAETGKEIHSSRLREILDALLKNSYLPEYGCCIEHFNRDWSPASEGRRGRANQETSYGHNVEFAWLMQRAAAQLDLPPARYRRVGLELIDHALRWGWHEEAGALCDEGPLRGRPERCRMSWWMQAENMVALDWAWRETGEARYLDALERQVDWVITEQADPEYGGWWDTVSPSGQPLAEHWDGARPDKAGVWHAGYHEVRACVNVATGTWE